MGPYIAVLCDSFHAALSSRVLWVAIVAIWLLLAALAPIGYREDYTTNFRGSDFNNGKRLKALLARGLVDPKSKDEAIGRIAAKLPDDLRRSLTRVGKGDEVGIRYRALSDGLNALLDDESWYDADAWVGSHRLRELRELDETPDEEISDSLRRRRARLRIEAVLPGVFQSRSSRSIIITYAGMDFPTPVAVDKSQFVIVINQIVMPFIIDWALGFALILLGILVTASIIPDMLQPGSLHLLLSKPISRPLLLISKFVGGCAFVFLCVVQLIIGLYLIAGLRLDLWNLRLLWCIPVAVFSFAVFYSVSMIAGLRWRSPILAIGVTVICGTFFMLVGYFGSIADSFIKEPDKLRGVAIVGDTILASTRGGGLVRFDQTTNRWVETIEGDPFGGDRILSPVRLTDTSAATAVVKGGLFNPFGSGSLDLLVLSESNGWTPEPSLRLPSATSQLFVAGADSLLALNTSDLTMTQTAKVLDVAGESKADESDDKDEDSESGERDQKEGPSNWLGKLTNMMGDATDGFEKILPPNVSLSSPRGLVVEPNGQWLVGWTRGQLLRLERKPNTKIWQESASRSLPGESSQRGLIGLSGDTVLVSRSDDAIRLFNAKTLQPLSEIDSKRSETTVGVAGLGDGRFVLVTSNGHARLIQPMDNDRSSYKIGSELPVTDVHYVSADPLSDSLIVVHHIDQIDQLDLATLIAKRQIRPTPSRWRMIDRYLMSPLRMIVPQTGELGDTVASIISGKSGFAIPGGPDEGEIVQYNIYRPVVSCSVFIVAMLSLGCLYFSTRDF